MAKRALLVIDMVNDFINSSGTLYIGDQAEEVTTQVKEEIEWARSEEIPVIYIKDNHRKEDAEFEMFPEHCKKGSWGAEIPNEITPKKGDIVISKRRYSAFFGSDLDLTLRELGVEELILTGVCTNICVLYTAADARNLNYGVIVKEKAVSSFDQESHKWALQELESTLGAEVK